ncbi:MAG: FAD-dependent oxidoreductase [Acidimicrobiales bacterium]
MRLLVVGGSDAAISAGLRARELSEDVEVTLVVADAYPNFSICGIPYHLSGEVPDWRSLAHRSSDELASAGLEVLLEHTARRIDPAGRRVTVTAASGRALELSYDALVVATGVTPLRPPIDGLSRLGAADGLHFLHTMADARAIAATLADRCPETAVIVGAGYIGLEVAEALAHRGLHVVVVERLPQVLPTVDAPLAAVVQAELEAHGVEVATSTRVTEISRAGGGLVVTGTAAPGTASLGIVNSGTAASGTAATSGLAFSRVADLVLVVTGVRPDTAPAVAAGAATGAGGALAVDRHMRSGLPMVYAAGDCAETYHRVLGSTSYLPLGTTAHKQGRVAGENAAGGEASFAGSLGTQVVKVFDLVAARTGLRDHESAAAGFAPRSVAVVVDDHKAYYPGAQPVHVRLSGDGPTGRLLGVQMIGAVPTGVAKRIDTAATALYHEMPVAALSELDLSYTPPLGSPWDVLQVAAQAWEADARR